MISDVVREGGYYVIYDQNGKEISKKWWSVGELLGFGSSFVLFCKNGELYTYDAKFNYIFGTRASREGEFVGISGQSMNFRRNGMIYTLDKSFHEISHRKE